MNTFPEMNTLFVISLLVGLHIELGDCHSYYHDMIFLRDLFNARQEISNELYCYIHHGSERSHWSRIPELYQNYILPRRSSLASLVSAELQENCFDQFTKRMKGLFLCNFMDSFFTFF